MDKVIGAIGFLSIHFYVQLILCPSHIFYALATGYTNPFQVTNTICRTMGVKFRHTKTSSELVDTKQQRVIFLCNHVSWADFFIDQALTGGGSYLSRMMVWVGTPVSSFYAWLSQSTWFFNRKPGVDREWLANWMNTEWDKRPDAGMVAYPEGTRNQTGKPLKLKTGVLEFAYRYKYPIQCVITTNKDQVINEKKLRAGFNKTVVTSVSCVVDPAEFEDQSSFVEEVRKTFEETWNDAYNCKVEDSVP